MAEASIKDVRDFFGMNASDMIAEWKLLSDQDKIQIKEGIGNGTFTY